MNKIVFVRYRSFYKDIPPMVDILYSSGRMVSLVEDEIPKTVKAFLETAKAKHEYDEIYGHSFVYYPI